MVNVTKKKFERAYSSYVKVRKSIIGKHLYY